MRVDEYCGPEGVFRDKGDLRRPPLLSLKRPERSLRKSPLSFGRFRKAF
jgi:hypothetical protein